jgi:alpha-L-fucosidase
MKRIFSQLLFIAVFFTATAQTPSAAPVIKTSKAIMEDFMDLRFGMFIHWGPVTLRGTEIGWSRTSVVPAAEYDNLYKQFNPLLFSADAWVKTAKDAGMKYLTITSKHHDGFCLWPTAYSDYNIMNSPYKKDIVGELAKSCKKYGIKFCVYFTVLDWHDPDYPIAVSGAKENPNADMNKFVLRMKNELKEIITKYDPYMLWFDGNWEKPWTAAYAMDVYTFIKQLNPDVIVNNRLKNISEVKDAGDDHVLLRPGSIGDYATPEQRIGALNMSNPWETCMTICEQWAWKPNDKMKSLKQCLQTLVKTAAGNGNLLFNVGPMANGQIEARQVLRLKEMGDWLKLYGESIYGTNGGPFTPNDVYAATRKGNKLYIHVFERKSNTLILPALPAVKVKKAYFLKGRKTGWSQDSNGSVTLELPDVLPNPDAAVIVLELNSSAVDIPVIS